MQTTRQQDNITTNQQDNKTTKQQNNNENNIYSNSSVGTPLCHILSGYAQCR